MCYTIRFNEGNVGGKKYNTSFTASQISLNIKNLKIVVKTIIIDDGAEVNSKTGVSQQDVLRFCKTLQNTLILQTLIKHICNVVCESRSFAIPKSNIYSHI